MAKSVAGTAADPTVPFTPLEIDDEEYSLVYDFNAIARAEKIAGCNLFQGFAGVLVNEATASQYRGLLYAAMLKAHPKITIDEVGALIRLDTLVDIHNALAKAYVQSMPEKKRAKLTEQHGENLTEKSGNSAGQQPE